MEFIKGYEKRYSITKDGRVYSHISNRYIKTFTAKVGYRTTQLGRGKTFYVHRLVAKTFISNPENLPCVNHKDGNKHNNNIDNLEWCSHQQNSKHASKNKLLKLPKKYRKCVQIDPDTNEIIKTHEGASKAGKALGINGKSIREYCNGNRKNPVGGFKWKWCAPKEKNEEIDDDELKGWKPVPDPNYEHYKVSSDGRVYNTRTKRIMKQHLSKTSGTFVSLSSTRTIRTTLFVHKLVATLYLPNPENLNVVRHKDRNKINNCVENLEWSTIKKCSDEACQRNPPKSQKVVRQYDLKGNFIQKFSSIKEAEKELGSRGSNIGNVCSGKLFSALGYRWSYETANAPPRDHRRKRKVVQIDKKTGKILEVYDSITDATKAFGKKRSDIGSVCQGKIKSSLGYRWKYLENV